MTVGELIQTLKQYDKSTRVVFEFHSGYFEEEIKITSGYSYDDWFYTEQDYKIETETTSQDRSDFVQNHYEPAIAFTET